MKVLFTTDGSACSTHAIQEALRLLPPGGFEAAVVAVADAAPLPYGYEGMAPGHVLVLPDAEASARQDLERAVALLEGAGVPVEAFERLGAAGAQILEVAADLQPDLIVLGTHGRSGVERLLMGSVSGHVVHHWPGACLVIRPSA